MMQQQTQNLTASASSSSNLAQTTASPLSQSDGRKRHSIAITNQQQTPNIPSQSVSASNMSVAAMQNQQMDTFARTQNRSMYLKLFLIISRIIFCRNHFLNESK